LPLVPWLPPQAPDAVQLVALLLDQLRVVESPLSMVEGLAERLKVGAGGSVTRTVTLSLALPPAPEQVNVKVLLPFRLFVGADPLIERLPLQAPLAVQAVLSVLVQFS
jgi:hypothetical protein